MAGGGKGSLQFAVCHKSVGLWHLRLPRAHCAVGMAKIYMVITNDICLPLPDLALSYYVPSRHVNLPIKHIWIPQIIPQKRSNSRKFGQNSTHSSTDVINIYILYYIIWVEKNKYKIFHFLLGILKTGLISTYLLKKVHSWILLIVFWACCFMNPKNEIPMCRILLRKTESTSKWNFPNHPFHFDNALKYNIETKKTEFFF